MINRFNILFYFKKPKRHGINPFLDTNQHLT